MPVNRRQILTLGMLLIAAGCARARPEARFVKKAVSIIEANSMVSDPELTDTNEEFQKTAKQFNAHLATTSNAAHLKLLFYECLQHDLGIYRAYSYHDGMNAIMYRLAGIGTDEAAKTMVDLYADRSVGWDGGFSLQAEDAIVRCGKPALPYLEKCNKHSMQRIIHLIKAGTLTAI